MSVPIHAATVECSSLPPPDNGSVKYTGDTFGQLYEGTVANYVCNEPYVPNSTLSRTCVFSMMLGAGIWNGSPSTCEGMFLA